MAIWIQFSALPANTEKTMMRALIKLFLNVLIFLIFYVNYRSNLCRKIFQAKVFVDLVQELSEGALKLKVFHMLYIIVDVNVAPKAIISSQ